MRRGLIGGSALAALWFVFGWAPFLLQSAGGSLATPAQAIPSPMGYGMFGLPVLWAVILHVLIAAVLVAAYALLAAWLAPGGRFAFASSWLAAILSAFLIGASLDLGNFVVWIGRFGIRGALGTMGATPLTVWWAALVGWIPALVAMSVRSTKSAETGAVVVQRSQASKARVAAILVGAVALIALPFVAQAGHAVVQEQLRQEQAHAQAVADPDGAAPADPAAAGDPVPTAAPSS
ncbi:hypothetical protein ACLBXX_15765 [Microbacterium sp. C23T]